MPFDPRTSNVTDRSIDLAASRRGFCRSVAATVAFAATAGLVPGLAMAQIRRYPDMIGTTGSYTIKPDDTLVDLCRTLKLGFVELIAANQGVDPWIPEVGSSIVVPSGHLLPDAPREGLVVNLADQRVYFFPADGGSIDTAPIGIGVDGWGTPLGRTTIVRKAYRPTWFVPASIRKENPNLPKIVPPGPDNPLGEHALYLGWQSYLVHGTNIPEGVGRRASHGCLRLYPEDIARLFKRIAVGTAVTVVDQPFKIGRHDGELYVEAHTSQSQADELEETSNFTRAAIPDLRATVEKSAGKDTQRVDWALVDRAVDERTGVPLAVLKPKAGASAG